MPDPGASRLNDRLIAAAKVALERNVLPALQAGQAASDVQMVLRMLELISVRAEQPPRSLFLRTGLPPELLQRLHRVTGQENDDSGEALEEQLSVAAVSSSPDRSALFADLARHEKEVMLSVNRIDAAGAAVTYLRGKIDDLDANDEAQDALTEAAVARWLSHNEGPSFAHLGNWKEIPGGFNKRTVRFGAHSDNGDTRKFALRSDIHPNPTGFSVVQEFPILQAVDEWGGVSIARPVCLQNDPSEFVSPFMISEFVDADDPTTLDTDGCRALARTLAESLARLHQMPVDRVVLSSSGTSAGANVGAEVERWYERWRRWRIEPNPVLEAAWTWLRRNIPTSDRVASIVHGDVGPHNLLASSKGLTALLDWEFCHIGDPIEDLVYCKPFLQKINCWSEFLAAYREAGGIEYDASCETFYEMWPSVRNGSGCNALFKHFFDNDPPNLGFGVCGAKFMKLYEVEILERMMKSK